MSDLIVIGFEQMIAEKVTSGRYPSAGDVILEALRLMCEFDQTRQQRRAAGLHRVRAFESGVRRQAARTLARIHAERPRRVRTHGDKQHRDSAGHHAST